MSLGVRKGDRIVIQAAGATPRRRSRRWSVRLAAVLVRARQCEGRAAGAGSAADGLPASGASPGAGNRHRPGGLRVRHCRAGSQLRSPTGTQGVVASRGLGVGLAFQFARAKIDVVEAGAGVTRESAEFDRARETVRADLDRTVTSGNDAAREIAEAHLGLVDDPDLVEGARRLIESGKSAGYAWRAVLRDGIEAPASTE